MRRIRKKNLFLMLAAVLFIQSAAVFAQPAISAWAAPAEEIEIDDEEYNLYVEEYPYDINEGIYAKFRTAKSNYDDYYLNFSSDESEDTFAAALDRSGINYTSEEKLVCSMDAALYRIDEDADEDRRATDSVEVLMPVPDDAQEHPEDAVFYMVSGGSAREVDCTLVVCDEVYYNRFTLTSYTTYGYVYNDPYYYDEDDEDDEDEEDDAQATSTPAPTPTARPTATASPTAIPSRDSVPKTGDDFSYTPFIVGGVMSLAALVLCIKKLTKR